MKKFGIIIAVISVAVIGGGIFALSKQDKAQQEVLSENSESSGASGLEYYWGEGCPHCANVAEFLDNWEHTEELGLNKMEIYRNQLNAAKLKTRAASCGIAQNQVGVPFLYTPDGQCIVGDEPIIEYFKNFVS